MTVTAKVNVHKSFASLSISRSFFLFRARDRFLYVDDEKLVVIENESSAAAKAWKPWKTDENELFEENVGDRWQ